LHFLHLALWGIGLLMLFCAFFLGVLCWGDKFVDKMGCKAFFLFVMGECDAKANAFDRQETNI
jgi:hypothetical protein